MSGIYSLSIRYDRMVKNKKWQSTQEQEAAYCRVTVCVVFKYIYSLYYSEITLSILYKLQKLW
jgi:hypothetical protein